MLTDNPAIPLNAILKSEAFLKSQSSLAAPLGRTLEGRDLIMDLAELSPLLISGCTGSGKSMFLHMVIHSLQSRNSPDKLNFLLIDPKRVEFYIYQSSPYLRYPVAYSDQEELYCLDEVVEKMNDHLDSGKSNPGEKPAAIVVIIDEFSDLILNCRKRFRKRITTIASHGKEANIHLILSTSIPSTRIITRAIKNHFPNRMAFRMARWEDSIYFLGQPGAEQLLGDRNLLLKRKDSKTLIKLKGYYMPGEV